LKIAERSEAKSAKCEAKRKYFDEILRNILMQSFAQPFLSAVFS